LYVCAGCFKYAQSAASLSVHRRTCGAKHPPGRPVYQRGAHIIWQVDGDAAKLYVQNLCLFGKLFIDHKTLFYDVSPFLCYVLTDATSQFDHVLGFFSKEKISYDDYNLACIVVFPPYQRRGYGTLLVEYSYYLSRHAGVAGTPERPLSELGLKGYIAFWSAQMVRTLQAAFAPDGVQVRRALCGLEPEVSAQPARASKRRRGGRGWAGEARSSPPPVALTDVVLPPVVSLATLAAAAGLRVDDATLALAHAGLLEHASGTQFVLSSAAVAAAAHRLHIKPAILEEAYIVD
jgi:hypothetical protein